MWQNTKYKRHISVSPNECLIYQLIESCLKLNLDYKTAIEAINVVLKKRSCLFDKTNKRVTIKIMDTRNYFRYVLELKKMSPVHRNLYKELKETDQQELEPKDNNNPFSRLRKKKSTEINQIENLLFLTNDPDDQNIPYKKHVLADTDELILKALIYLDKKYIF